MRVMLSAAIALVVMTSIGIALLAQGDESNGRSTIAVGVIVAAVIATSLIYRVERWSLVRQSAVHFALMTVTVLPALFLSGWFPLGDVWGCLAVVGVFLGTGAVLWGVLYVVFGKLVRPTAGAPDA